MKKSFTLLSLGLIALTLGFVASQSFYANPPLPDTEATIVQPAKLIQPFELTDYDGQPMGLERLKGQWSLLFFGFTYCPDVCPTTLSTLRKAFSLLPEDQSYKKPQVIFVSVDPERDHLQTLKQYVTYFNPDFLAATGTQDALQKMTRPLGILYAKVPNKQDPSGKHYLIDHSASILVVNPEAKLQAVIGLPHEPKSIANDLVALQTHFTFD